MSTNYSGEGKGTDCSFLVGMHSLIYAQSTNYSQLQKLKTWLEMFEKIHWNPNFKCTLNVSKVLETEYASGCMQSLFMSNLFVSDAVENILNIYIYIFFFTEQIFNILILNWFPTVLFFFAPNSPNSKEVILQDIFITTVFTYWSVFHWQVKVKVILTKSLCHRLTGVLEACNSISFCCAWLCLISFFHAWWCSLQSRECTCYPPKYWKLYNEEED